MATNFETVHMNDLDFDSLYRPTRNIVVVKKDGSKEEFNVSKVINAVGKSAYRALTKFTEAEKRQICTYVIDKVDELQQEEIPRSRQPLLSSCRIFLPLRKVGAAGRRDEDRSRQHAYPDGLCSVPALHRRRRADLGDDRRQAAARGRP